jgi:pectinesterase inhibitor-like protein
MAFPYCLAMVVIVAAGLLHQLSDAILVDAEVKADKALVDSICEQTDDYNFCFSTFDRDPRTPAADRHGLALLSIALNIDVVQETIDRIPKILESITDPMDKQRLEACQSDYGGALEKLHGAYKSSSEKSYREVMNWVIDGVDKAIHCEGVYSSRPPISESPIEEENQTVIKLANITFIIIDPFLST